MKCDELLLFILLGWGVGSVFSWWERRDALVKKFLFSGIDELE